MSPKSWKRMFNSGDIMPAKKRFCTDKLTCNNCNNQMTENKNFEAKLNFLNEKPLINLVICFLIIKNDFCDICFSRMIPCTSQIRIILLKRFFSSKKSSLMNEYYDERNSIIVL